MRAGSGWRVRQLSGMILSCRMLRLIVIGCLATLVLIGTGVAADSWPEVYDPFRVRTLHLQMESGSSWGAVVSDSDFDNPQNAQFWMEAEAPIAVTVKRKSDPAVG